MRQDTVDLFNILDIPRREDSYSSLLCALLCHSPRLRQRVIAHGFPAPPPDLHDVEVHFRKKLSHGGGVVDLLVCGRDRSGRAWELFIENKIDADESPRQTLKYLEDCRQRCEQRASGILLTIDGRTPQAPIALLSHRVLGGWVSECIDDVTDPVLRVAADAYVRRARAAPPNVAPHVIAGDLLTAPFGLLPSNSGWDALGAEIAKTAANGWSHHAIWIQGPAHSSPGLQFHRPGWWGNPIQGSTYTSNNRNIHLEVELVPEGMWRLKLHFESEPYMTRKELTRDLDNFDEFESARERFRAKMHERANELPSWKMTNYFIQVAARDLNISSASTIGDTIHGIASGLAEIASIVESARLVREQRSAHSDAGH